jgi:hypothetical protein
MEYLIVRFHEARGVLADKVDQGQTNQVIELESGTYTISLAPPANFKPKRRKITLSNTSPIKPKEITFAKA